VLHCVRGILDRSIASGLIEATVARLGSLGAPRVYLMTVTQNTNAHRLFERLGFRNTMFEMTRECPPRATQERAGNLRQSESQRRPRTGSKTRNN
jgi:RimJ/RimL family protein N-acetyltransferase